MENSQVVTALQAHIQNTIAEAVKVGEPVFNVKTEIELSKLFNRTLADSGLTAWNCSTCDTLINRLGRLATVCKETGKLIPVVWQINPSVEVSDPIRMVIERMAKEVTTGKISSHYVLSDTDATFGLSEKGGFNHLHFDVPDRSTDKYSVAIKNNVEINSTRIANMVETYAGKTEKLRLLITYLGEKSESASQRVGDTVKENVFIVDKCTTVEHGGNMIWRFAAMYGEFGRAGVKGLTVGDVMEAFLNNPDEEAGLENAFDIALVRLDPRTHKRPTTLMEEISDAEFERGVAGIKEAGFYDSIARRTVGFEEVREHAFWTRDPKLDEVEDEDDIFAAARKTNKVSESRVVEVLQAGTVKNFVEKVLPNAKRLYFVAAASNMNRGLSIGNIMGAKNPESTSPLSWSVEEYNEYSWAMQYQLTAVQQFRGDSRRLVEIDGLFEMPCYWNGSPGFNNTANWAIYSAEADVQVTEQQGENSKVSNALFPDYLKAPIRKYGKVIEAINNKTLVENVGNFLFTSNTKNDFRQLPLFAVDDGETIKYYELFVDMIEE